MGATNIAAKLQALRDFVVEWLGDPQDRRPKRYFDYQLSSKVIDQYVDISRALRSKYSSLFDDLPVRKKPRKEGAGEFNRHGYTHRHDLELLLRDINYCINVLSQAPIEKKPETIPRKSTRDNAIQTTQPTLAEGKRVFVVHGHDEDMKNEVALFLAQGGLDPIILHEKPNKGRTIIEKFEDYSDVAYAVVLLTADDVGGTDSGDPKLQPRARQNVVFEFGFFIGRLQRDRVCALCQETVKRPSDIDGLVYILLDESGAWKRNLAKELESAGLDIALDKALS